MPTKVVLMLGFVMLYSSCNNEGKTAAEIKADSTAIDVLTAAKADSLFSGCYSQIAGRDTSNLQIENKDSIVNGTLSYAIFEKDRNDGTVQAVITGDILKGWYLFKSEGIISVREVAWKIKGNELWPGTGEMIQKNDTMFFSAPDQLRYDNTRPFKKVECII